MNLHAFATSRRVIAAAIALTGVGLAGSSVAASGIKTVGTVVYAQAPTPGYYAAAPGAYGQAPYYLVTNHHKQYIVPAAAFAPQAYAPAAYAPQAYVPQAYAPQAYAPQAYAPQASAPPTYYYPTTASAPKALVPVAAAPAPAVASAPEDETEAAETTTSPEFKLTGAVLQTFVDDLRKFYETSSETGGMAKVKALKEEAKTIYSSYDESAGEIAPNKQIDQKLDELVAQIVKRDRDRLKKSGGRSSRPRWAYTIYGWQLVQGAGTDDDDDEPQIAAAPMQMQMQMMAPAPMQVAAPYYQAPAPQLYYVPTHHRSKFLIR